MTQEEFQALVLQQLQALACEIKELKQGQAKLEANQQKLEANQQKFEANLLKIETKIENQVIEKLRGLYDDRDMQNDRLDRIERRLDKIEADTSYLVVRVAKLESIAK